MPSPIGHALAGVAVAWSAEQLPSPLGLSRPISLRLTALSAALAASADLDLLYSPIHRTATHSVTAVALVLIVAIVVTGWVRRGREGSARGHAEPRLPMAEARRHRKNALGVGPQRHWKSVGQEGHLARVDWAVVLLCTAAYATHLLLDWLGADPSWPVGIQMFWPFSERWVVSGWNVFPYIERREMLSTTSILINLKAIAGEVVVMGPIVLVLGSLRTRRSLKPKA